MSSLHRLQQIETLKSQQFDVLVIGGGITGAGIALDAASRGLTVALIEMADYASGTSSKSTKLIHGGLRYLKQFEVGLVREVGLERATVHKLAPHLVIPEKMLLPFTKNGTFGYWTTSFALKAYDVLAGVKGDDQRRMLSKEETIAEEPLLRKDILEGSGLYAEYRTDDARLTIENIKTAAEHGAMTLNYVKADRLEYDDVGKTVGVNCIDQLDASPFLIRAKYVVNAAGPWVDELRVKDKSKEGKYLFLSKGVHIVIPHEKIPLKHSVYIDAPDGRMIFLIPRLRVTYIGTTDTEYTGDKNRVLTSQRDVQYLLDATNRMFPSLGLSIEDVVSSWAGLRPLIHEEGKSPSEISRKDEIFESASGLLSIAGGKLTGYRKMAERIIDLVAAKYEDEHEVEISNCRTNTIPLIGGPFDNSQQVASYVETTKKTTDNLNLPGYFAAYLVYNYGRQCEDLLKAAKLLQGDPEIAIAKAEVRFCIEQEQVFRATDFFIRRTGRLYFNIDTVPKVQDIVLDEMQNLLGWDSERRKTEAELLAEAIREITVFEAEVAM